ncbi:MAG: ATP-binding cassette domain-containing protein [Chloroflexi bacterium]|nr:ATP-binding cassette domain-containing protein [Chloroflexota bacterium]MCI0783920.1 ATP-binding cassette domain-containing protein [Chloroflexota bacterium]
MPDDITAVLTMERVTKVFGEGDGAVKALDDVDFVANAGEVIVIMGPSGSGKTTFLTTAGALLTPTSGTVKVSNIDITNMSESELPDVRREKIGFIFQSFNLLESLTATENVRLVLTKARRGGHHPARELLDMLGLGHRLNSLPKQLSGGEKQRVAIARALVNNPDLILADEPTANLDAKRGREVMLLLRQIALEMQKAVVIVSHDHRIREIAHRVVWLEDGTFLPDVATTRDPVCNRVIEVEGAPTIDSEGQTYHFCGHDCRKIFEADPARFDQSD